jgi:hypothetical protein
VKSWKGSETATGETPVFSGKPKSFMVKTLEGEMKSRCSSGLKATFPGDIMAGISTSGMSEERFLFEALDGSRTREGGLSSWSKSVVEDEEVTTSAVVIVTA